MVDVSSEAETPAGGVERFIRRELGCQCPEELFRHISRSDGVSLPGAYRVHHRLDIGHRLLVYIFREPPVTVLDELLRTACSFGIKERNEKGFNRLRIVLATSDPAGLEALARALFEQISPEDGRVHLHVVEQNALPF